MTKFLFSAMIALGLTSFSFTAQADQPAQPAKEVLVGVADAFVPSGFDSNSEAYVVASGLFPNGCYRFSRSEVTHQAGLAHEVRIFASVQQGMCLMVLVPFNKEVSLGKLEAGVHTIRFMGGDGTFIEKKLEIR
ncbi:MAG: hypothetical protein ACK5P7_01035 [Bdellovibrio sp.]|jgi:hypothetical protein